VTNWREIYEAGKLGKKDNLCTGCYQNFASVNAFDRHRIGNHEYTFWEGQRMHPPRDNGRRCRDIEEMQALGFVMTAEGRWSISPLIGQKSDLYPRRPKQASRARQKAARASRKRDRA
jgi:hypothetical protein